MEKYSLYGGKVELCFDPARHLYTVNGNRVHGTTSILNMIAKPALIGWAANLAAETIGTRLKPGIAYDEIQIKEMLDEGRSAHRMKKEKAADKGTLIHEFCEAFIKGKTPAMPVNEELRKSAEAFLLWRNANDVEFLHSEVKVYSKKYNYAGTLDFIARVNGKLVIGDIKSSSGIYNEMGFQVAAYQQARQEEYPKERYEGRIIVRCGKNGELEIREFSDFEKDLRAFLGAWELYERAQTLKDEELKKLL